MPMQVSQQVFELAEKAGKLAVQDAELKAATEALEISRAQHAAISGRLSLFVASFKASRQNIAASRFTQKPLEI